MLLHDADNAPVKAIGEPLSRAGGPKPATGNSALGGVALPSQIAGMLP